MDSANWSSDSIFYDPLGHEEGQAAPTRMCLTNKRQNLAKSQRRIRREKARQKAIEAVREDLALLVAERAAKENITRYE